MSFYRILHFQPSVFTPSLKITHSLFIITSQSLFTMSSSKDGSVSSISHLTSENYRLWSDDIKSWLQLNSLWHLVNGSDKRPAEKPEIKDSSGTILSQAVPLDEDKLDLWETLKTSFIQQRTAPRFNAYHALLSVEKSDSESLDSLINRVDEHIRVIKSLSPSSFSLDNLYDELAVMAIIRALPHSFDNIVRTISILDKFDRPSVIQSLQNMDQTCTNLS